MTRIGKSSLVLSLLLIISAHSAVAVAGANDRILFIDGARGVFSVRPDGSGAVKLATGDVGSAVWSPDRSLIAFLQMDEGEVELWVMEPDGSAKVAVAEGVHWSTPSWSPDGSEVTIVRAVPDPSNPLTAKDTIFAVDVDTGDERLIAQAPQTHLGDPQWSPQGSEIAFVAAVDDGDPTTRNQPGVDIYKVDVVTGTISQLTDHPDQDDSPRWSPDGNRLAFVSDRDDVMCAPDGDGCPYTTEIYVMSNQGDDETRLTHNRRKHDRQPTWAADGSHIAWTQSIDDDVNGTCCYSEIFVMNEDGMGERRLTRNERRIDSSPSFSPNGNWIVFSGGRYDLRPGRSDLYKARVDGSRAVRMTATAHRFEATPDW